MASKSEKALFLDTSKPESRRLVYEAIRSLSEGQYSIDLTRKRWRVGSGQRAYYWGYIVVEVSKLLDRSREDTDKVLNSLFLSDRWIVAGQIVTVCKSLSDLDPDATTDYFNQIYGWVYETYGVRLSPPVNAQQRA